MKHLITWTAGSVPFSSSSASFAQGGTMMRGDWWSGNWIGGGGFWMAIAMVAIVALVIWAVLQNKK